jgi:beta-glucosidase
MSSKKPTPAFLAVMVFLTVSCSSMNQEAPDYLNPDLSVDLRVNDLVGRMTLDEKASQALHGSAAIERLGVPEYNWWNEALHGVARAGHATVFPQAIGLAATWDTELMARVATAISDEARAKHHEALRRGSRERYDGLTFWSPNINIFRDPRWGRGMETFGEDPYLTGRLAVEFVKGMQGDHPVYLKTVATPKHYAVHSGPEPDRHSFDAVGDERDLRETYLPAFRTSIIDGGAESVMCAYNRVDGEPACGSNQMLQNILRDEWGFDGYIVSDCWAIKDIYKHHKVVETPAEAAAMAVANGTDLNCGVTYEKLGEAVRTGLLQEEQLDRSLKRLFRARFRLGMFDPPERVPWSSIPMSVIDSEEHQALALETARKSMVLLKNEGGVLPLDRGLGRIAVIGPNADDVGILLGNYNGVPSDPATPLRGIRGAVSNQTEVVHAPGGHLAENMPALHVIPETRLYSGGGAARKNGLAPIGRWRDNRCPRGWIVQWIPASGTRRPSKAFRSTSRACGGADWRFRHIRAAIRSAVAPWAPSAFLSTTLWWRRPIAGSKLVPTGPLWSSRRDRSTPFAWSICQRGQGARFN